MKKLFVLASAVALLASCSNEDFETDRAISAPDLGKGIVFEMADPSVATRGYIDVLPGSGAYHTFLTRWNAEADRIGIIAANAKKGVTAAIVDNKGTWGDVAAATRAANASNVDLVSGGIPSYAVYKATTSGARGYWTASNDENMLHFDPTVVNPLDASFRAFYPVSKSPAAGDIIYSNTSDGTIAGEAMLLKVPANDAQAQETLEAPVENFIMVANPIEDIHSSRLSVGESLPLQFERPFAIGVFSIKGYDHATLGNLTSIKIESKGGDIAYAANTTVDIAGKNNDGKWTIAPASGSKIITLTMGIGAQKWSDDAYAYVQMLPVTRSGSEDYEITYAFANMEIKKTYSSSKSWEQGGFYEFAPLDLNAMDYYYLATSNTLCINSGCTKTVAEMVTGDTKLLWGDDLTELSAITTVISKKVLSASDLETLKAKFTGVENYTLANQSADLGDNLSNMNSAKVTSLTLTEATTAPVITSAALTTLSCPKATAIPASAYASNATLTNFNFPVVETIGASAFYGCSGITEISCGTAGGNKIIIGTTGVASEKTSALTTVGARAFEGLTALTTIDAPALSTIDQQAFGYGATYSSLTHILLPAYAFDSPIIVAKLLASSSIEEVDFSGVAELGDNTGVMLATPTALTKVTLKEGAKVGKNAFSDASRLATVVNLDKAVEIGENAFKGTALVTVTLGDNITEIGASAFENTGSLTSITNTGKLTTIGKNAFKGSKITSFDFSEVTTIGEGAFSGLTALVGEISVPKVTTLEKDVFKGVRATTLIFDAVTSVKEGALVDITTPTIMFKKALTSIDGTAFAASLSGGDGASEGSPKTATVSGYKLYLNRAQAGVAAKVLSYQSSSDDLYCAITFEAISKIF